MGHADRVIAERLDAENEGSPSASVPDRGDPVAVTATALVVGAMLAAIMPGPVLGGGSLVNLDMVAVDHWPFPRSLWGIGPELPRLGPIELAISGIAALSSGATAVKLLLFSSLMGAYVGMARLVAALAARPGAVPLGRTEVLFVAHAAALLYATSPYVLTRVAVGHLAMIAVYALLPFTATTLFRPSRTLAATTLALLAHAVMGFYGALIVGLCVVAGLGAEWRARRRPRPVAVVVVLIVTQLLWLPAALAVLRDGTDLQSSEVFTRGVDGVIDAAAVLAGFGFWQPILQVGGDGGPEVLVVVGLLVGFALAGRRWSDQAWNSPSQWCAAGAIATVWAMSWTPVADVIVAIPGGAAVREPQRLLPLYLLWLAPAALVGAVVVSRRVPSWLRATILAAPVMASLVLAVPGVWGVHDRLEPVELPAGWSEAREIMRSDPGTALVLPWHRYVDVAAADDRRALNPAIRFFGPDVVVGNDLGDEFTGGDETADQRNAFIEELLPSIRAGAPVAGALADLGISWVVITHDADYLRYLPLLDDPGLTPVLTDVSVDVLRVRGGWGPARSSVTSEPISVERWGPVIRLGSDDSIEWSVASGSGWRRDGVGVMNERGTATVAGGAGLLIFWPAGLVVAGALAALGAGVFAVRDLRRSHRGLNAGNDDQGLR